MRFLSASGLRDQVEIDKRIVAHGLNRQIAIVPPVGGLLDAPVLRIHRCQQYEPFAVFDQGLAYIGGIEAPGRYDGQDGPPVARIGGVTQRRRTSAKNRFSIRGELSSSRPRSSRAAGRATKPGVSDAIYGFICPCRCRQLFSCRFSGGAALELGTKYLLTSLAIVLIGGASGAGGNWSMPGFRAAPLALFPIMSMLQHHVSARSST